MQIGEFARLTETTPRLLRYYEEQGLIIVQRDHNGYRSYDDSQRTKVQKIRCLLGAGMPTRMIQTILPCVGDTANVYDVPPGPELREDLIAYRDRLDITLARLNSSRDAINDYLLRVKNLPASDSIVPAA